MTPAEQEAEKQAILDKVNGVIHQQKSWEEAVTLIVAEMARQDEKYGYTDEHIKNTPEDYGDGELAIAAASFLTTGIYVELPLAMSLSEYIFPWGLEYFKPSPDNRIKELVKAGAMIIKEINRLKNSSK